MPSGKITLLILIILGLVWTAWSWYVTQGLEKPVYTVLKTGNGYEIREYEAIIIAETVVESEDYWSSLNEGFRIVAGYIFGDNASSTKIAMTTPVLADVQEGERIAMTTPVFTETTQATRTVAFVMPREYTLQTLPIPNDKRVTLREVSTRTLAVRTFSWFASQNRIDTQAGKLRSALAEQGVTFTPRQLFAAYDPPGTIPFLRRYEVMVEVTAESF